MSTCIEQCIDDGAEGAVLRIEIHAAQAVLDLAEACRHRVYSPRAAEIQASSVRRECRESLEGVFRTQKI